MRFLSLFSGIEAASAAWVPLGWTCVGVCEIERFPCKTLAARHPGVPNLGDITKITEGQVRAIGRIDVLVFGSPCQDLSVAGKRKGFTDANGDTTRSGLFFAAMRVIGWARKHCGLRFAVWENVPGAFSSNGGADFATVVGELGGLEAVVPPKGWGTEGCAVGTEAMVEWSTLDAQWFGVAQRRRRVFAVADFGDWASRPPILLESEGLRGDSAPSRGPWQDAAAGTLRSTDGGCDVDHVRAGHAVAVALHAGEDGNKQHMFAGVHGPVLSDSTLAFGGNNQAGPIDVATARNACASASGRMDFESETFLVQAVVSTLDASYDHLQGCSGQDANHGHSHLIPIAFDSRQDCVSSTEVFGALGSSSPQAQAVCVTGDITHVLKAEGFDASGGGDKAHALVVLAVRRLTPRECERLQGFPDDHTLVPIKRVKRRSKLYDHVVIDGQLWQLAADGPRYKALGNSMAVPVMAWIGRQIDYAILFDVPAHVGATRIVLGPPHSCNDLFA